METLAKPLCFWSAKQFDLWAQARDAVPAKTRCANVCRDCLPSFQLRMKKQRRCARPETMFTVEDGGVVGIA